MCSTRDNAALPALGFPIRASAGHRPFSASPRLIAAVHALLRLLVPRHPPCALTILTVIFWRGPDGPPPRGEPYGSHSVIPVYIGYCAVFKGRRRRPTGLVGRSLKTQQHAGPLAAAPGPSPSRRGRLPSAAIQPGSVDMLGPIRLDIAGLGPVLGTGGSATARAGLATGSGSGHR